MKGDLVPTAKLRFVSRAVPPDTDGGTASIARILQQWWAPDVPAYMVDDAQGEWRDIPFVDLA